jgi:hypothetical protein
LQKCLEFLGTIFEGNPRRIVCTSSGGWVTGSLSAAGKAEMPTGGMFTRLQLVSKQTMKMALDETTCTQTYKLLKHTILSCFSAT